MIEFKPWPKIARLNRDIVITEKIDGTNAAVGIVAWDELDIPNDDHIPPALLAVSDANGREYAVYAQSRKRLITPDDDNFGFAGWVAENAETLYP